MMAVDLPVRSVAASIPGPAAVKSIAKMPITDDFVSLFFFVMSGSFLQGNEGFFTALNHRGFIPNDNSNKCK
jgi:hypothetical protein